jgi:hypothetical protein
MTALPTQIWSAAEWHAHTLAAGAAPAVAPEGVTGMQAGGGAIVVGLLVAAFFMIKHKKWSTPSVLVGFILGTALVGATGLLGMPATLVNSLMTSASTALGNVGIHG